MEISTSSLKVKFLTWTRRWRTKSKLTLEPLIAMSPVKTLRSLLCSCSLPCLVKLFDQVRVPSPVRQAHVLDYYEHNRPVSRTVPWSWPLYLPCFLRRKTNYPCAIGLLTFAIFYFASSPPKLNQISSFPVAWAVFVPPNSHPLLIDYLNQYCELLLSYFAPLVAVQVE